MKKDTYILGVFGAIGILVIVMIILAGLIQFKIVGMEYYLVGVMIGGVCMGALFGIMCIKNDKIEGAICRAIYRICPLEDA